MLKAIFLAISITILIFFVVYLIQHFAKKVPKRMDLQIKPTPPTPYTPSQQVIHPSAEAVRAAQEKVHYQPTPPHPEKK